MAVIKVNLGLADRVPAAGEIAPEKGVVGQTLVINLVNKGATQDLAALGTLVAIEDICIPGAFYFYYVQVWRGQGRGCQINGKGLPISLRREPHAGQPQARLNHGVKVAVVFPEFQVVKEII